MTPRGCVYAVAAAGLLLLSSSSRSPAADVAKAEWLRSSGKDLQIRLRGEVLEADGRPAADLKVTGGLNAGASNQPIEATVEGGRFEVWIPVNRRQWSSLWLKAASADGKGVAYKTLCDYELRQAAIDGIKLTLRPPTHGVDVKVTDGGRPVPGPMVQAEVEFRIELRSRADDSGTAHFALLPEQKLHNLTAWTDDFRIGGYCLNRKPVRDPNANEQVVELSKCRNLKLRFVDESGKPAPGVDFLIHVGTGPPNYNFMDANEHSRMTTDATGEATYRWLPDWKEPYYYVDVDSKQWVLAGDKQVAADGAAIFTLKPRKPRKQVSGRLVSTMVNDLGGFSVSLWSFQGEQEHHSDPVCAFTDSDGGFSVDVLPDATYCAYMRDTRWVSDIIDLLPFRSATGEITSPQLSVKEGQEVQVTVTSGPKKKPYPNLTLNLHREYQYSWREGGRARNGTGGPQWWATTDDSGRATFRASPGPLRISIYTPSWRTEKTVDVRKDAVAQVTLHREVDEKQKVTGRLLLPAGLKSNLEGAEIQMGAVDGHCDDRQTLTSAKDGSFSLETLATEIGVFAYTRDGQAAGSAIVKDLSLPIALHLLPTMDYHGQLLGDGDGPLVDHGVSAIVPVEGEEDYNSMYIKSFTAKQIDAKTGAQGNYTLRGVPSKTKVLIRADAIDGSDDRAHLGSIYLEPGESRPRAVNRLANSARRSAAELPLAKRYDNTLRDCRLCGFRLMVITRGDGKEVADFVDGNLLDREANKDVTTFMQIVVAGSLESLKPADAVFVKERNWQLPAEGHVRAYAIDAEGKELGRLDVDVARKEASGNAADFVHTYAPPRVDAEEKWDKALAEAKKSRRRVWARVSQRYCGPCFRLARWLDDHHELLAKDYVMLKIDDVRDRNGGSVAKRLTLGRSEGVPFFAIFDPDGKLLIDSDGPLGNMGYPTTFEDKKQLRKMLLATRQNLTDDEIDQLVESVGD